MLIYLDRLTKETEQDIQQLEQRIFNRHLMNIYKANANIHFYIYYSDEEIVGYMSFKEDEDYYEIYNIAVKEKFRKRDIATQLLNMIREKNCYLDVRDDNIQAIKLYEKNGFRNINRRKNYYGCNDALIYERLK